MYRQTPRITWKAWQKAQQVKKGTNGWNFATE